MAPIQCLVRFIAASAALLLAGGLSPCAAQVWKSSETKSPMGDPPRLLVYSQAVGDLSSSAPALIIQCNAARFDLILSVPRIVLNSVDLHNTALRLRFDEEKAMRVVANKGNDPSNAFIPRARAQFGRMLKAKRLRIEFQPAFREPQTVEFNMAGLAQFSETISKRCPQKSK